MSRYKIKFDNMDFFDTIVNAYGVADAYWKGVESVKGWVGVTVSEIERV